MVPDHARTPWAYEGENLPGVGTPGEKNRSLARNVLLSPGFGLDRILPTTESCSNRKKATPRSRRADGITPEPIFRDRDGVEHDRISSRKLGQVARICSGRLVNRSAAPRPSYEHCSPFSSSRLLRRARKRAGAVEPIFRNAGASGENEHLWFIGAVACDG